jgi:hypothetical protein
VLRDPRGEEHLLLRRYYRAVTASILPFALNSLPLLATLSHRGRPTWSVQIYEELTLSRRIFGTSEAEELKDIARSLTNLWETAQRLPEGSERQDAFRQICSFQRRVAALVTRAL